jgi:hypothetical protein
MTKLNDLIFGDGFAIDAANALLQTLPGRAATGLLSDVASATQDADYSRINKNIGAVGNVQKLIAARAANDNIRGDLDERYVA